MHFSPANQIATARRLEVDLRPHLTRYDTAVARLRTRPHADRFGAVLDRLGVWSAALDTLARLAAGAPGGADDRQALAAAVSRGDAARYIDAVAGMRRAGRPDWHPCRIDIVSDLHAICHPDGLDICIADGQPVRVRPGAWRQWPLVPDTDRTPDGAVAAGIGDAMAAWEQTFASPLWRHRHPLVHAAMATAALWHLSPFPSGNETIARLVAQGVLRGGDIPVAAVFAAGVRRPNGGAAAAVTADALGRWSAAFAAAVTTTLEAAGGALMDLRHEADALAWAMPAFPARLSLSRAQLALELLARPVDTPAAFAARHRLSRPAAERILRRLVESGQIQIARVDGRQVLVQVLVVPAAIALLRRLARGTATAAPAAGDPGSNAPGKPA